MSKPPKKFSGTKWKGIPNSEMLITTHTPNLMISWRAMCNNKTFLAPSFCMVSNETRNKNNFKYFLLDDTDMDAMNLKLEECKSQGEKEKVRVAFTQSLTSCAKQHFKHVHIRSMAPSKVLSGEADRVFAEDVLEIIPVLLDQQNTPIDASDERLEKYRNQWKSAKKHMHNTIDMVELERVLEEFDVNKTLLTVVPDPILELCRREFLQQGVTPLRVFTPNIVVAMDTTQAILFTFHTFVCGNNWKKDTCKMHNNCNRNLKKRLLTLFNEYANMDKGTYVTNEYIFGKIEELKNQCILKYKTPTDSPDYLLKEETHSSNFDLHHYNFMAKLFDIPKYDSFFSRTGATKMQIPVWMMRLFFKFGWIESFFDENDGLRLLVANSLIFLVPQKMKEVTWKWMQSILDKTGLNLPRSSPSQPSHPPPLSSHIEKPKEPSAKVETENSTYKKKLEATEKRNEMLKQRKEAKKNKGATNAPVHVPKKVEKKLETTSGDQNKNQVKTEDKKNETKSQSEDQNSENTAKGSLDKTKGTVASSTVQAMKESEDSKYVLDETEVNSSKTLTQYSELKTEITSNDSETVAKDTVKSDHEDSIKFAMKRVMELHQKAYEATSCNEKPGSESALRTMESIEEVKKNFISEFIGKEMARTEDHGNNDLKKLFNSNEQVKKFAKDVGELMAISVDTVSSSKQESDDSKTVSNSNCPKIVEEVTSKKQSTENSGTPQTSKSRVKVIYKLCDTCNLEELQKKKAPLELESEITSNDSKTSETHTVESDPLHETPIEVLIKRMTEQLKANEGIEQTSSIRKSGSESTLRAMESLKEIQKNFISEYTKQKMTKTEEQGNDDSMELLKFNEQVMKYSKDVGQLMARSLKTLSWSKQEIDDFKAIRNLGDPKTVEEAMSEKQSTEDLGTLQTPKNQVKVIYKLCDTCKSEELQKEKAHKGTSTSSMDIQELDENNGSEPVLSILQTLEVSGKKLISEFKENLTKLREPKIQNTGNGLIANINRIANSNIVNTSNSHFISKVLRESEDLKTLSKPDELKVVEEVPSEKKNTEKSGNSEAPKNRVKVIYKLCDTCKLEELQKETAYKNTSTFTPDVQALEDPIKNVDSGDTNTNKTGIQPDQQKTGLKTLSKPEEPKHVSEGKQEDDLKALSKSDELKFVIVEKKATENTETPQEKLCDTCKFILAKEELRKLEAHKSTTFISSMDLQNLYPMVTMEELNSILPSEPKQKYEEDTRHKNTVSNVKNVTVATKSVLTQANEKICFESSKTNTSEVGKLTESLQDSEKLELIPDSFNRKTEDTVPQVPQDLQNPEELYSNSSTTTSEKDQHSIDAPLSSTPAADDVASESFKDLLCPEAKEELNSEQLMFEILQSHVKLEENLNEIRKKWEEQKVKDLKLKELNAKQADENLFLKEQIISKEATEEMLKRDKKMLINTRNQLTEKIIQLEAQLESKEQTTSPPTQFEKELQEKNRIIAELKGANIRSSIRNEELSRLNKELLDRWTLFHSNGNN